MKVNKYKIKSKDNALGVVSMILDKNWKRTFVKMFGDYGQIDTDYATWYRSGYFNPQQLVELLRSGLLGIELRNKCFLGNGGELVRFVL
jgi:hypothetical protein